MSFLAASLQRESDTADSRSGWKARAFIQRAVVFLNLNPLGGICHIGDVGEFWADSKWVGDQTQASLKVKVLVTQSCLTLCDPLDYSPPGSCVHGILPGKNTGVGSHSLLQRILLTQGSNLGLLYCRQILSHQGTYGQSLVPCESLGTRCLYFSCL